MSGLPEYGSSRIQCANPQCSWQGLETDRKQVPHHKFAHVSQGVCPDCSETGYFFIGGVASAPDVEIVADRSAIEALFAADFEAEAARELAR